MKFKDESPTAAAFYIWIAKISGETLTSHGSQR